MRYKTLILFFFWHLLALGQLHDKTWICGSFACKVTFEFDSIDTLSFNPHVLCRNHWACISDSNGNFQFFTEGVNVYSYDGIKMVNGDSLADSRVNSFFYYGLPDCQNTLILPKKNNQYYIIYQSVSDILFATLPWHYTDRLYYSVVDMDLQNGKGEVIEKRNQINSGNFMDGHMTACQHANGRDWWLVQRGYNNNRYFIYLVTPYTISFVREQFIGAISQEPDAIGQSAFSPDGTKYATITAKSPLILLDFDRCEGMFSNPLKIDIPKDTFMFFGQQEISGGGGNGLCFSPDNRFIYTNTYFVLRQYDLFQTPIDSSEQVIFFWTDSIPEWGLFDQMYLGPNGKIYLAPYHGISSAFHVINHPDSNGFSCGFVKWGLPITTDNAFATSNMPHFRLGTLVGSGCDTITAIRVFPYEDLNNQIRVYPNPARDAVEIDLMSYAQYHPLQQFYLYNSLGQLVKQVALPYLSGQLKVSDLPYGVYHWKVTVKEKVRGEGKLEVVR